ncbi:hypothetical protein FOQG_16580 [Fusarium oxysporum f. sp. raphani 54005]|uniref:Uncharacterized protein n=1 Tax=Fusarium oxysporum f. sp. raphani 54005 TaxID=1089458 RepID=X0BAH4_FUSOX|nr:hypothetical protein FOQG_16580 [Fusarium oxysporum f. sp. raphani 54005]
MVNGSKSALSVYLMKRTIAVFSTSKVAPMRPSQDTALLIIACIPLRLLSAVGLVTHERDGSTASIDLGLHQAFIKE